MLEDLREEGIVNKVGGRFKLSTLIQKRLVQLNAGSRPLVDHEHARQDADRAARDPAGQDLSRLLAAGPPGRAIFKAPASRWSWTWVICRAGDL